MYSRIAGILLFASTCLWAHQADLTIEDLEAGRVSSDSVQFLEAATHIAADADQNSDFLTAARARIEIARYFRLRGMWEQVIGNALVARERAESGDSEILVARANLALAGARFQLEQPKRAQWLAQRALDAGDRLGDHSLIAGARIVLSSLAGRSGDFESALAHVDAGLLVSPGLPELEARLRLNRSLVLKALGKENESRAEIARASGIVIDPPIPELAQTLMLARMTAEPDSAAAAVIAAEAAVAAEASGNAFLAAFARAAEARRLCVLGRVDDALQRFDAALARFAADDIAAEIAKVQNDKAKCLASAKQFEAAYSALEAAKSASDLAQARKREEQIAALNISLRIADRERELAQADGKQSVLARELALGQRNLWILVSLVLAALALAFANGWRLRSRNQKIAADAELQAARSHLLAVASHEIRNPIQGLTGALTALIEGETDPRRRGLLTQCHHAVQMIARLSNDAFDLSLMDQGRFQLRKREYALAELIGDALSWVEGSAKAKGLVLIPRIDGLGQVRARIDVERLSQVLLNLLTNAIRYSPRGTITIDSAVENGQWLISVADQGPGLDEHDIKRLFSPYYRGKSSTETSGGGLGLSVAKRIVEAHHGELRARNREPGPGAVFEVRMPIEYSANTPMPSVSPLPQLPLRNLRLLIVDDDELVRLSLRINAELAGAGVLEAENGRGLSDSVRAFRPDVVLCDRRLEREDGVELLHQLHAELGAACPKLILMTGSGAPPSTDDAIKTVLQKPFSSETLLAAIQQSVSEA